MRTMRRIGMVGLVLLGAPWTAWGAPAAGQAALRAGVAGDQAGVLFAAALKRVVLPQLGGTKVQVVRLTGRWDVGALDPVDLAARCAAGMVRKLDWAALGGRQRFVPGAASDCGAGAYLSMTVLSWDPAKVPGAPSWQDFWDVVRIPGKRGLRKGPEGTLEIALMADGVAPRDVYAVLRGKDGVARAFRKLDQLRPYIVWWQHDDEPMRIVAGGQALMSSAPSEQVVGTTRRLRRNFGLQWRGGVASVTSWAVDAQSADPGADTALIKRLTEAGLQAQVTEEAALGGTGAVDAKALGPALIAISPTVHLGDAVMVDAGFWREQGAALGAKFDAWLRR